MNGFYDLFAPFSNGLRSYDRALNNAKILRVVNNSAEKKLTVTVGFSLLMSEETLHKIGIILASELKVDSVVIEPVFPAELLSNKYDGELVKLIKQNIVVANGFLEGCTFTYDGQDSLTITLARGGRDILVNAHCGAFVERIIKERFGVEIKAVIEQSEESACVSIEEMQKKIDEQMLQKAPEKKKEKEVTAAVVEEGYPYYTDSLKIVYGSLIKGKPMKIDDIESNDDRVVVWGEVFGFESRLTKNGDKYIISFNITDNTNSISVVIFEKKDYCGALLDTLKDGIKTVSYTHLTLPTTWPV